MAGLTAVLVGCGSVPAARVNAGQHWGMVSEGTLALTRQAVGTVVPASHQSIAYGGAMTTVARDAVHPGQSVKAGAPLVWLASGAAVTASAAGVVAVVAPVGAYVGHVPPGIAASQVPASTAVAVLSLSRPLTVSLAVPQAEVKDWPSGDPVTVSPGPSATGRIQDVARTKNGMWLAKATFPQAALRPVGSHVTVTVTDQTLHHVLQVPAGAVISQTSGYAVRTRRGLVRVSVVGAAPLNVAVRGPLRLHQAVWIPSSEGSAGLAHP